MKIKLRYVVEDTDRHGNVRLYFRKPGEKKIRLRDPLGSPEFLEDYRAAVVGKLKPLPSSSGVVPGSLRAVCVKYFASAAFRQLEPTTQRVRRGLLERLCRSKVTSRSQRCGLSTSAVVAMR